MDQCSWFTLFDLRESICIFLFDACVQILISASIGVWSKILSTWTNLALTISYAHVWVFGGPAWKKKECGNWIMYIINNRVWFYVPNSKVDRVGTRFETHYKYISDVPKPISDKQSDGVTCILLMFQNGRTKDKKDLQLAVNWPVNWQSSQFPRPLPPNAVISNGGSVWDTAKWALLLNY